MATRDETRAALARLGKRQLIAKCRNGITRPDGRVVESLDDLSAWARDDLIAHILDVLHPADG